MKMFDSIDSVEEGKYDWNLRVRLVRVWDSYSSRSGKEFKGKNLLLLDDKHARIHAFIWPNNIPFIKCEIKEGKIYTIRNVQVKTYRQESIKCIQSDKQLWFSNQTKMEPVENYDHMIPENAFDFYSLGDVKTLPNTMPKTQLIDVVGFLVESDYNIRKLTNSNEVEQTQLRFSLTDGRNTANFCFWDEFALSFDSALKEQEQKPVIVIVSSCRYNIFKQEVHLSNLTPTRFFLNYDHHSVEHLRERYNDGGFSLGTHEEVVIERPEILTLQSIQNLQSEYIEKFVMCQLTISNVEEKSNWWYYVCTKCHKEVRKHEEEYECQDCKRVIPYPDKRFRLCVNAEDETGGAAILMYDREVQRIIGKNVYQVVMLQKKSGKKEGLPEIFKSVEGKQYTFTLQLTEGNVKHNSYMYNATDIFEGFEIVENSENPTENSNVAYPNSELCGTISENQTISLQSFNTPDTEKSTTLKPAKRKIVNIDVDNMSSLVTADEDGKIENKSAAPTLLKNIKKERD